MKRFESITVDFDAFWAELAAFETLLQEAELSERKDLLPFFGKSKNLAALIGYAYHPNIKVPDRLAYEFSFAGDFTADIAVGDSERQAYCLIELEEGKPENIFKQGARATKDWTPRFEHGFSQIVDWLWKIDDLKNTTHLEESFDARTIDVVGILVIGRNAGLDKYDKRRLQWRTENVKVSSHSVLCYTFDDLKKDVGDHMRVLKALHDHLPPVDKGK